MAEHMPNLLGYAQKSVDDEGSGDEDCEQGSIDANDLVEDEADTPAIAPQPHKQKLSASLSSVIEHLALITALEKRQEALCYLS